jgi:hypothetical protein
MANMQKLMMKCPACHERGISPWDKVFNSPWRHIVCAHCGQRYYFHWLATLIWMILTPVVVIAVFSIGIAARQNFGVLGAAVLIGPFVLVPIIFPLKIWPR